jgi:hypothetical protein
MSASAKPKRSVRGRRPYGLLCCFLLLTTISSVWIYDPDVGLPGFSDPVDEDEEREIDCPATGCPNVAKLRLRDGAYVCITGHISRRQSDGSIKWEKDPTYVPPSVGNI